MEKGIGEVINLAGNALKNIDKVAEGIVNKTGSSLLSDEKRAIIEYRKSICNECEFNSRNKKDYQTIRTDDHCTICSCNIEYKTHCLSCNCGIEVSNMGKSGEDILKLKWVKINE
jgi:hypothetical protein